MHLSYCTNVHPAEDLDGVIAQLDGFAGPARIAAGLDRLGVGLWLPVDLAARLVADPAALAELADCLARNGLEVRTLNAFPYRGFHADVVKLAVYSPDWTDPARADYTLNCARVLAALLPPGACGSISTLPLAWREPWDADRDRRATAEIVRVARQLAELEVSGGRLVRLAVEPEPGCVLDTVDDVVDWLAERASPARPVDERIDPRYVGVCLDTCHLAVSFADPGDAIRRIHQRGLRIVKVQASAALELPNPADPQGVAAVRRFVEPRYLHQVRERTATGTVGVDDLPEALESLPGTGPWRVHFHVPLHHRPNPPLRATTDVLLRSMEVLRELPYHSQIHLDVETYTWSVLPAGSEPGDLVAGLAAELRWAGRQLLAPDRPAPPTAGPAPAAARQAVAS